MVHKLPVDDGEVPQDLKAFFGHPLNSSFQNDDGALALLHEYESLPAIEKARNGMDWSSNSECDNLDISPSSKEGVMFSPEHSESSSDASHLMILSEREAANDDDVLTQDKDEFERLVQDTAIISSDTNNNEDATTENLSKIVFKNELCDTSMEEEENMLRESFGNYNNDILDQYMEQNSIESESETAALLNSYLDGGCLDQHNNNNNENSAAKPIIDRQQSDLQNSQIKSEPHSTIGEVVQNEMPIDQSSPKQDLMSQTTLSVSSVKQEQSTPTLPSVPQHAHLTQQVQIHQNAQNKLQQGPTMQQQQQPMVINQNGASMQPMSYPMMPQFMPVQIVQTSSGPMQVQPFIHNGHFGITQVTPCRPQTNNMIQPRPPMGMAWSPQYFPYHRMMGPEAIRMQGPPGMYCAPPEYYMMRPTFPIHNTQAANPPTSLTISTQPRPELIMQQNYQPRPPMNVCQQIRLQQQLQQSQQQQLAAPDNSDLDKSTVEQNDSSIQPSRPTSTGSKSGDTLQRACALSNIQQISTSTAYALSATMTTNHLKSPDSGFGENHAEVAPSSSESEVSASNPSSPSGESSTNKRRRGSMCSYSRQCSTKQNNSNNNNGISYVKREDDDTGYQMRLEAATSCGAKLEEDRMTYLNKGQYYTLVMENVLPAASLRSSFVKSVVTLKFKDDYTKEAACKCWHFWHSRQTDVEDPKGIELDLKNSEGIIEDTLEYVGTNAFTFAWDPHEPVKAPIAVHCLSTDFSNQKGVKGLPLHIQIDTYDDIYMATKYPVHRAYAQIKIFCDKGAERKARDEEKKKEKAAKPSDNSAPKLALEQFHPIADQTEFYSMADLVSDVLIYNPPIATDLFDDLPLKELADPTISSDTLPSFLDTDLLLPANPKRMRMNDSNGILVYVREAHEAVFTALMINNHTIQGLVEAIQEKFEEIRDIRMLYKRTSRGILVKLDDNLVKHFIHESMYMIDFKNCAEQGYDITLIETDL